MPVEFIGREIEVELSDEAVRRPTAFRLGRERYEVTEVLANWQDQGFGSIKPDARDWQRQQHRNYYRVRTAGGEVFEIYADQMASRRQRKNRPEKGRWYAHRRLSGVAEERSPAARGEVSTHDT